MSGFSNSRTHQSDFSIGAVEVSFSSEDNADICVGDFVVAAGTLRANRMRAYSVYDLSTGQQSSAGVVSNLFVAAFVGILGLFGTAITSVFLVPFNYFILLFSSVCVLCLVGRSFRAFVASIMVWYRRSKLPKLNKQGEQVGAGDADEGV